MEIGSYPLSHWKHSFLLFLHPHAIFSRTWCALLILQEMWVLGLSSFILLLGFLCLTIFTWLMILHLSQILWLPQKKKMGDYTPFDKITLIINELECIISFKLSTLLLKWRCLCWNIQQYWEGGWITIVHILPLLKN